MVIYLLIALKILNLEVIKPFKKVTKGQVQSLEPFAMSQQCIPRKVIVQNLDGLRQKVENPGRVIDARNQSREPTLTWQVMKKIILFTQFKRKMIFMITYLRVLMNVPCPGRKCSI